ncbi:MAG: M1 family aminopeptidase [Candidatus Obscuribacterales bacterium]
MGLWKKRTALVAKLALLAASAQVWAPAGGAAGGSDQVVISLQEGEPYYRGKSETQYARERKVDILHLLLDVTPDFEKRTIKGEMTMTFEPLVKPVEELRLDAIDMDVAEVICSAPLSGYQVTDKEIIVTFEQPIPAKKQTKLSIKYSASPKKGLYFRVPSNGYEAKNMHVFSQCEMIEARHWFPCYDYPNEKFTSSITCRVPEAMMVASNGKQISSTKDAETGLKAVTWLQDKPHSNYLITLVAGNFARTEEKYKEVPLQYFSLPVDEADSAPTYADTPKMMAFLEKETGVPYPWDKYGQVAVQDFPMVGMENTSLTTLADTMLCSPDTQTIQTSIGPYTTEELLLHELAHQWFGDLVTCRDWSHAWLNEGFATYYAQIYLELTQGRDGMIADWVNMRDEVLYQKWEWRPVVNRQYNDPEEQFDHRAYFKAAWVLRMLREELGDELFRKSIQTYLQKHRFQNVITSDFTAVVEEVSGKPFDRFFDQWLHKPGHPEVAVEYSWDEKTKLAKLTITQQQRSRAYWNTAGSSPPGNEPHPDNSGDSSAWGYAGSGDGGGGGGGSGAGSGGGTGGGGGSGGGGSAAGERDEPTVFHFPLTVKFKGDNETITRRIDVTNKKEDFSFTLKNAPKIVQVDPECVLLAEIDFTPSTTMLFAQLEDKSDPVARMDAADKLRRNKSSTAVTKLMTALITDESIPVRIACANSLRRIHSDEALDALLSATKQRDARVKNAVIENIGKFYHPRAEEALRAVLDTEKNPAVVNTACLGLSAYNDDKSRTALIKSLGTESFHDLIAVGALQAIRAQAEPFYIDAVKQFVTKNAGDSLASETFREALDTLAVISKKEEDKSLDDSRNFILQYVNDKREPVQVAAIRALGALGDPKAVAALKTFASGPWDSSVTMAASGAIFRIQRGAKPQEALKDLRRDMKELKDQQRELKQNFEKLAKDKEKEKSPPTSTKEVRSRVLPKPGRVN